MAIALLLAFFVAFNVLEATLPSLVSRIAPAASRGAALGVYNTSQSLASSSAAPSGAGSPGVSAIPQSLYSESRLSRYGWERHGECAPG